MNLYGLFLAVGLLAGLFWFLRLAKKLALPTNLLIERIFLIFIIAIVGARIFYIFLYPEQFSSFFELFAIWQGGLVSFGGILFGFLVALVVFRGQDRSIWLNILAPSFFLGWFFGRLGGFFSQNAVGMPSTFFGSNFYHRVPTPLFESILSLIIVVVSSYLIKSSLKSNLKAPIIYLSSLIIYFFGRSIIDFWRDEPILIYHLKLGQIASAAVVVWCIILLIHFKFQNMPIKSILSAQFLREQDKKLETELEQLKKKKKEIKKFPEFGSSTDDAAQEVTEFSNDSSLVSKINQSIKEINEARKVIARGSYGICRVCGEKIVQGRLKAMPEALTCSTCHTKMR